MTWSLGFMLLAAVTAVEKADSAAFNRFENYAEAYRMAQKNHKPMLVILIPSKDLEEPSYSLERIAKTRHRRELLQRYVVVVIGSDTESNRTTQRLFGSPISPRVVVIDKGQEYQVFQTTRSLQGEDWNRILEVFQDAKRTTSLNLDAEQWCPT